MKKITQSLLLFFVCFSAFAQFPAPYCGPIAFALGVEPITLVTFAGINNSSPNTLATAAHQDFTAISGSVTAGQSYPITLKGNTDGNWNNNLSVFIDWNQNGVFTDAGETYNIGSIFGSTGLDAVVLNGTISVPGTALGGNTRMRVVKKFNNSTAVFPDSCNTGGTGYGQAEDYTLAVTAVLPCLTGINYPTGTLFLSTCDGFTPTSIAPDSYSGDYFNVGVLTGQTYKFSSSIATDFYTISTDNGATATISGTQPLTWVSTVTGTIRVHINASVACGADEIERSTSVTCGVTCLTGTLFPEETYTPTTCDGTTVNLVSAFSYAGEYSNINVFDANEYTFSSSIATDYITVASANGLTALAVGTGSVSFSPTADGVVRVYFHTNNTCGTQTTSREKRVVCTTAVVAPDCVSNPTPADAGTNVPAFDDNLTFSWNVATTGTPATSYNVYIGTSSTTLEFIGNVTTNSVVIGTIGEYNLTGYWQVVPVNAGGEAVGCTVWSFTTEDVPPPPLNDNCSGAIALTAGGVFGDNDVVVTNVGATVSGVPDADCGSLGSDVWYSIVVPTTTLTVETQTTNGSVGDTVLAVYSGDCAALTEIACSDDDGIDAYSIVNLTGLTVGSTIYFRLYSYADNDIGTFALSAYDPGLATNTFDDANFLAYPNPVKDILNLSYSQNIDKVQVVNLLGQEIIVKTIGASQGQIDMSSLAIGTYLVKVTSDNQVKTIKVIKE